MKSMHWHSQASRCNLEFKTLIGPFSLPRLPPPSLPPPPPPRGLAGHVGRACRPHLPPAGDSGAPAHLPPRGRGGGEYRDSSVGPSLPSHPPPTLATPSSSAPRSRLAQVCSRPPQRPRASEGRRAVGEAGLHGRGMGRWRVCVCGGGGVWGGGVGGPRGFPPATVRRGRPGGPCPTL